ncbi:hypothetical protein [Chengkuizengella sediminis]|uniref:hypothetical protein n=1 Tax=Chengkuizengella sediminis TaxID=1885917 RepID=UPI001389BC5F|nr:hypothetical protein [Chengkuizengella sediminis]NDI35109.1 hypothetical protein [Chengkuizengella sediminis]
MGFSDESICDCCIYPMQSMLEQVVGQTMSIVAFPQYLFGGITLIKVNNFIAFFDVSGTIVEFPIHKIVALQIAKPFDFNLKPIRKSEGECSYSKEIINSAKSKIGGETFIIALTSFMGIVRNVGEGMIILSEAGGRTNAISSCGVTELSSLTETTEYKFLLNAISR